MGGKFYYSFHHVQYMSHQILYTKFNREMLEGCREADKFEYVNKTTAFKNLQILAERKASIEGHLFSDSVKLKMVNCV